MMSVFKVPIWPDTEGDVPMTFLHGEPGWYVWLLHKPVPDLNQVERDMMLLYNNGDLKDFQEEVNPEPGMYVCTLSENNIIRGLVLNKYKNVIPEEGAVVMLDVDSGKVSTVPKSKIKVLPTFACKAPARAVRCDLGLDCKERFDWPPQVDEMLKRALCGAELLVTFESERPGSIPTVSVSALLWDPFKGSAIDFRVWLTQIFGPHLVISSLDGYIPEPICKTRRSTDLKSPKPEEAISPLSPHLEPPVTPFSWNPYEAFQPNTMFPQVGPPPGFSPLNPFSINQGYVYPPLPWPVMLSLPDIYATPNMYPSTLPQNYPANNIIHGKSQSVVYQQNSPVPLAEIADKNSLKISGSEVLKEPLPRSFSPVLTLESLLDTSPSLSRKPVPKNEIKSIPKYEIKPVSKYEVKPVVKEPQALTVDSLIGTSPNLHSAKEPSLIRKNCATKPQANARFVTHQSANAPSMQRRREHITFQSEARDWPVGTVVHVIMSYVESPEIFTANVVDSDAFKFDRLQKEMKNYEGSLPLTVTSKKEAFELIGNFCVCFDIVEELWVRAEVLDWRFDDDEKPINVWLVDFGGGYDVPLSLIRGVEGYLCSRFPIQSTLFSMHNVRPRQNLHSADWPEEHCAEFRRLMPANKQFWLRIEKPNIEGAWPVSVFEDSHCQPPSLNDTIVQKRLAFYHNSIPTPNQPSINALREEKEWDPMRDDFERGGRDYNCDDEDACYAVSGLKPNEEKNVCRFFLEKGKCPKGLNCRQRHIAVRPGGWTLGKEMVYTSAFNDLDLPEVHSIFDLRVTKILNVHHFFGVRIPSKVSSKEEHFQMLLNQMNNRDEVKTFQFCKTAPAFGQLVIARDSKNDYWFRARIIDVAHDVEDKFEVSDVDTGITRGVHLRDLREMNPAFLHLPFQAIECFLADTVPVLKGKEFSEEGCHYVSELVKNQRLKIYVVKRTIEGALEVDITVGTDGRGGQDLRKMLMHKGYIKHGSNRIAPSTASDVCRYIPG